MSNKSYGGELEDHVLSLCTHGQEFIHDGAEHTVILSGKPRPSDNRGECKTDVYVLTQDNSCYEHEWKISIKQNNADFLENKINPGRAHALFGDDWEKRLSYSMSPLVEKLSGYEFHPIKQGTPGKSTIRLGYRLDFINKESGHLCVDTGLSEYEVREMWTGENLDYPKRHSRVNGEVIENSGVVNYALTDCDVTGITDTQSLVDMLVPIDDFLADKSKRIYMTLRSVNLRHGDKYEKSRPLAVRYSYRVRDGAVMYDILSDEPLIYTSTKWRATIPDELVNMLDDGVFDK